MPPAATSTSAPSSRAPSGWTGSTTRSPTWPAGRASALSWFPEAVDLQLTDKAFLVTGGSRGLGLAAAQALVAEGAHVVIAARSADRVASAADSLGCTGVAADLGDPD